jgi:SAM-dependent methyltransferase
MRLLSHPLTRGVDVDDPRSTLLRREIIRTKPFLRKIYAEWYSAVCSRLPAQQDAILEIGSGAGFLKQLLPQVVTSEVFPLEGVDRVEDATALSYADASLDAIVMTDVLHHIPDVGAFLGEASRTLRPGGRLVMVEPWTTRWSTWVYRTLHPEPFRPDAVEWELPPGGPLSAANGALPWIVFSRDRARFEATYPELELVSIEPLMPVAYLASGGVSMRALAPGGIYAAVRTFERRILREHGAMFALIEVRRR